MNLIFLTMSPFYDLNVHNIYADLLNEFVAHGHKPYLVTPCEKKHNMPTELLEKGEYAVLRVQAGDTSNVSSIEKGISIVLLEQQYKRAIKKHLRDIDFRLVLYSTPPVTLYGVVKFLKRKYNAYTYLMLKDIFPQNAVDLGLMKKNGMIYKYFRYLEERLYRESDTIGCMSQANVKYVLDNNSYISEEKVEVCPNAILPHALTNREAAKRKLRETYCIPDTAIVYLFGGNLGKPQGITQFIPCLRDNEDKTDRYFIICGSGSEYGIIDAYIRESKPKNIILIGYLHKKEYDALAAGCDVGLIFLDYRFTIPNYPSRILSYMENEMPVIVCTDNTTDIGIDAENGGYGYRSSSNDISSFTKTIDKMCSSDLYAMGKAARFYLEQHFNSHKCYKSIMNACASQ